MIYAISLMANPSGCSIMDVDCSGVQDFSIDLFSSFLKALEALGNELLKDSSLLGINFGRMLVKKYNKGKYDIVIIEDKNEKTNRSMLNDIKSVLDEYHDFIASVVDKGGACIKPTHRMRIRLVNLLSEATDKTIGRESLASLDCAVSKMYAEGNGLNLYTKVKLLEARIRLRKLLDIDTKDIEATCDKNRQAMKEWENLATHWLRELKNCVFKEYIGKEISWTKIYMYLCQFSDTLKKITISEVVDKYVAMARSLIDKKNDEQEMERIKNEVITMSDSIEFYIRF